MITTNYALYDISKALIGNFHMFTHKPKKNVHLNRDGIILFITIVVVRIFLIINNITSFRNIYWR